MTAKPDARTVNLVHYPGGDATDPQELGAYLDAIETDVAACVTTADLASTANGDGAALVGIEDSGGLITATTVEGALAENRAAIDALEAAKADKDQTERLAILITTPDNTDYIFRAPFPYGATLTHVYGYCPTGTITATVKINGTAATGGAISISSSGADSAITANNSASSGDYLWITLSSNSSAENVAVTVQYTVELAIA